MKQMESAESEAPDVLDDQFRQQKSALPTAA
jgi:hypothetical protein